MQFCLKNQSIVSSNLPLTFLINHFFIVIFMSLFVKIAHFIIEHKLILPNQKMVIGFSGGPDSVFLVHALLDLKKTIPFSLHLAHLNHQWRDAALKEAQFCSEFAQACQLPITLGLAHNFSSTLKFNGSKEEFARNMRRAFFKQTMLETKSNVLALGHHADDQLETFFIRLMRGTTLSGIKGMLPQENEIIRPLLNLSKKEILAFLHEHNIAYCNDETNESDLFLRNRIRNTLIPAAEKTDNRFKTNSLRAIAHLADVEEYLTLHTKNLFDTLCTLIDNKRWLCIKQFLTIAPLMQHRIIMHWLYTEKVPFVPSEKLIVEIVRFLIHAKSTTHTIKNWHIYKEKSQATIQFKN
ncbi:MAG TPA: tRNA lysidine(34) synthetase TilS [Patescibacteria group bacterium]|jgi:tRNA(Ile)-lysidine synthase|nr:tRNA lysidine(34) synthetase TilS [Patescibacteria group bacterium]